jgi:adenine-specific DNA methylase
MVGKIIKHVWLCLEEGRCVVESEGRDLLISKWFPIAEVSVESVRERSTGHNPPTSRIHVWFARRPHATSRAAVLGSLLPSYAKSEDVLRLLGIPIGVDVRKAEEEILKAKSVGKRLNYNPFSWEKSFKHTPSGTELSRLHNMLREFWGVERPLVVDPMAGGGSIPFEAMRLGLPVVAGDLNPVAFICLKGTLEYPARFGKRLLPAIESFCKGVHEAAKAELEEFFPKQPGEKVYAYLWARTVKCSSCGLTVPLSPNWWIVKAKKDEESVVVKLVVPEKGDKCSFEIVESPVSHGLNPDKGTVKRSYVECPRCHVVISGEDVRQRARNAEIGHQLYVVCTKRKMGKSNSEWHYRLPAHDEIEAFKKAEKVLAEKLEYYRTKNLIPIEEVPEGYVTRQPKNFGMDSWDKFFNPRQLLTHITYLEKLIETKNKLFGRELDNEEERDFTVAVFTYMTMVFDACIDYNCVSSIWDYTRNKIEHIMSLQAFPFKWSYAEWDHSQMLWPWALSKVLDALNEMVSLLPDNPPKPTVYCGTATKIPLKDKYVPCIVVDPPYAENVFYGESSDFFYVWLKRLLIDFSSEVFKPNLTEKEEEAVSNPAKFKGLGKSAKKLAQEDYKTKMEACFREMRRILKDDGTLTVMFTHRTAEAWSSLATALMNADFTFISSWPVHTEPPGKYAKGGKGVLKITVLLTCRKRIENHPGIWEHIVEELKDIAKQKIEEFSKLGINGPDLKVSVYAPVLGKFADYYPVKTATGKEIDPQQALDLVTDVLNEKFLKEEGIQNADRETAAYINLLRAFPKTETEYEQARLETVFGGLVTLDTLDVKGTYGFIEKDGKNIKILSARDRQAMGIIDPYDPKTLKTTVDYVHAAILQYERGGLVQVKRLMQDKNLDTAGSPFPTVLQAYARYAENSSNENFQKDAAIAKALLAALGKSIEFAPKKGERLDHYTSES